MFALLVSTRIGARGLLMMLCLFAFQDALAADNLTCSVSAPTPSMGKNQSPPSQGQPRSVHVQGDRKFIADDTVQVCTYESLSPDVSIDSLDCRVSLTVKNPNGRFSITQYRCSSDGAPCDDIGVFSEPQRRPRKATGRDEVCVTFKSLNGSRGNAALIVRASPR